MTITARIASVFVAITNQSIVKSSRSTPAIASYSIYNNGTVQNQNGTILETWLNGSGGSVGNYDVMVTPQSGVTLSGTTGSWLNCGTTQSWSITNSAYDDSTISSQFLVQIRLSSSGVVQSSATVTLSATSVSSGGGGHQ